jgi:hypothetical protein
VVKSGKLTPLLIPKIRKCKLLMLNHLKIPPKIMCGNDPKKPTKGEISEISEIRMMLFTNFLNFFHRNFRP